MESTKKVVGFIGAGAMAEAIVSGLLNSNLTDPGYLMVSDIEPERLEYFKNKLEIQGYDNLMVASKADIIILAVKPKVLPQVLAEIGSTLNKKQLIISIVAGMSISHIEELISPEVPVVRVMPNTPCLVNEGASALSPGSHADDGHLDTVKGIFQSVGKAVLVPEALLDAVTGLSGSGPAYIFMIIESLVDGAVRIGLPADTARLLATQTVYGAAKLALESGSHPAMLKGKVTTPGGTTAAGLYALERNGVRKAFMDAVAEAAQRSQELSEDM